MACSHGETILQYFGTSWSEINNRIPELSEAGWTALWLPLLLKQEVNIQ